MTSCQRNARLLCVLILASLGASQGAAFYDPGLGRWLNRDPLGERGFATATIAGSAKRVSLGSLRDSSFSPYVFARNSPQYWIDPHGLDILDVLLDLSGGALTAPVLACAKIAAEGFLEMKALDPIPDNVDKYYHCLVSCKMTKACGARMAAAAGSAGEWASNDPVDSAQDLVANATGRRCACSPNRDCSECCEDNGYLKHDN
jgi:RHS repeat-associated protein